MTTKEEWKNYTYLMFGLIIGGAFSFFGSMTTGAFFAENRTYLSKEILFWLGLVSLIITFALSVYLYRYAMKRA